MEPEIKIRSINECKERTMHFKTIIEPFRIKTVEPIRHTTRAERGAAIAGSRLQSFSAQGRRRAHRPAHRLGHWRDVSQPVGGHDDGRRILCRGALVLSTSRPRSGDHRPQACDSHPSGPRRRAHPLRRHAQAGRHRAQQHPLRHHPRQRRISPGATALDIPIAEGATAAI